jgi:MinD-like ATPase involved in chromosome partitioning or flagellar assembly
VSDVPQAPYGDDGDARPVSLIGARIPASLPSSEPIPGASGDTEPAVEERMPRRRRRWADPEPTTGPIVLEPAADGAFHLHDHEDRRDRRDQHDQDDQDGWGEQPAAGARPDDRDLRDLPVELTGRNRPGGGFDDAAAPTPEAAGAVEAGIPPVDSPGSARPAPPATPPGGVRRTPPVRTSARARRRSAGRPSAVPPSRAAGAGAGAAAPVPPATPPEPPRPPAQPETAAPAADAGAAPTGRRPGTADPALRQPSRQPAEAKEAVAAQQPVAGARPGEHRRGEPGGALEPVAAGGPPALRPGADTDTGAGTGTELWPWQEPWETGGDLEPWEELPIRLSAADRAAAALDGSWRVVVTSLFAGSGVTTVTAVLGMVLADVRGDGVVAVDVAVDAGPGVSGPALPGAVGGASGADAAAGGGGELDGAGDTGEGRAAGVGLARRLGAQAATTVAALARHRRDGRPPREAAALVAGADGPLPGVLDVVAARMADTKPTGGASGLLVPTDDLFTPTALRSALGLLAGSYTLLLLDVPGTSPPAATALRGADVVVLVVLATPADLDAAAADLRDPDGLPGRLTEPPPAVVAVVVPARRGRWSPQTRAAAARLGRRVDRLVRIPYDVRLDVDAGSPTKIGRLRRRSRRAFLRLAADIVDLLADEAAERGGGETAASAAPVHAHAGDHGYSPGVSSDRTGL